MVGDGLGVLDGAAVFKIGGDAGCPKRVIANRFGQAKGFGPAFDHVEGIPAGQRAAGHLPVTINRAEDDQPPADPDRPGAGDQQAGEGNGSGGGSGT